MKYLMMELGLSASEEGFNRTALKLSNLAASMSPGIFKNSDAADAVIDRAKCVNCATIGGDVG